MSHKCSKHGVIFELFCPVVENGKLCTVGVIPPDPAAKGSKPSQPTTQPQGAGQVKIIA